MPAIACNSVDLPAPLAPMTATVDPALDGHRDAEERLQITVAGIELLDLERHGHVATSGSASMPR